MNADGSEGIALFEGHPRSGVGLTKVPSFRMARHSPGGPPRDFPQRRFWPVYESATSRSCGLHLGSASIGLISGTQIFQAKARQNC
jgi:hypothetical protein